MLEKLHRLCSQIESSIVGEQTDRGNGFTDPDEMVSALDGKLSLDMLKRDKGLIRRIKGTPKDIRDEALAKFYDMSLENDEQNTAMSQIYHYVREF